MKAFYQELVRKEIPLVEYMQWEIEELTPFKIKSKIPLAPNINIHSTGFAGSQYAAAMATGWTLLQCWQNNHSGNTELVAGKATIEYLKPVTNNFSCEAQIDESTLEYQKLITRISAQRSCAFPLKIGLSCNDELCAILNVNFVFKYRN